MENTGIEWCDHTFNPWRGCTKVSSGCANCYAETLSKRNPKLLGVWGKGKPRVRASAKMWQEPVKWNADAARFCYGGKRPEREMDAFGWRSHKPRVFCASLADWLDDEVPIRWLADLLLLIRHTPNLDWLLLTKRPQNWRTRLEAALRGPGWRWYPLHRFLEDWLLGRYPDNVWIGATVENQAMAEERIPLLLAIPAKVRFLSCEPLLGPVEIRRQALGFAAGNPAQCICGHGHGFTRCPNTGGVARLCHHPTCPCPGFGRRAGEGIHWLIAGGESGPRARPMHPDWARSLRDQCAETGVAFFYKQWGGHRPLAEGESWPATKLGSWPGGPLMVRVGKKAAGRLLDGQLHEAFPVSPAASPPALTTPTLL